MESLYLYTCMYILFSITSLFTCWRFVIFFFFIHNVFQVAYRPEGPGVKSMLITIDIPFKIMYTSLWKMLITYLLTYLHKVSPTQRHALCYVKYSYLMNLYKSRQLVKQWNYDLLKQYPTLSRSQRVVFFYCVTITTDFH